MPLDTNLTKESFEVYRTSEDISFISQEDINFLKSVAEKSDMKRARICTHKNNYSKTHEMLIALSKGSYIRPHLHLEKTESFHIVSGEVLVVTFDNFGNITKSRKLSIQDTFYYKCEPNIYHTVIPLSEVAVIHEVTPGPFLPGDTIYASFAPNESTVESVEYMKKMVNGVL